MHTTFLIEFVGYPECGTDKFGSFFRISKYFISKRDTMFCSFLCFVSVNKLWEVQKKFVVLSHCVGSLNFAKLALKTSIHDLFCFYFANFPYITVMTLVDKGEQERKTIAVFEAHSTSVANLESTVNLAR